FRIARNTALDHVQARKTRTFSVLSGGDDQGFDVPDSEAAEPESHLLSRDERRKVWEALGALSERDRTALFLRELEGLSYSQIAALLGGSAAGGAAAAGGLAAGGAAGGGVAFGGGGVFTGSIFSGALAKVAVAIVVLGATAVAVESDHEVSTSTSEHRQELS